MFDLQHTLDLMEEGAFDEAASTLEQVVAQMPAYAPAYVLLAQAYEAQTRWAEALETWQQAHFFAPNSPVVEAGLLRVLDRYAPPAEHDDASTPETADADPMDRLADALIETIREKETAREQDADALPPESPLEESPPNDEASPPAPASDQDEPSSDEPSPEEEEERGEETPSANAASAASGRGLSPVDELAQRLPAPNQPLPPDIEDLDRLIDELESARIDPQPDLDEPPPPDLDHDIEDMVSETLARIYISQKQYAEAARVYMRLAEQEPDQADEYFDKAADLRLRARSGEEGEGRN